VISTSASRRPHSSPHRVADFHIVHAETHEPGTQDFAATVQRNTTGQFNGQHDMIPRYLATRFKATTRNLNPHRISFPSDDYARRRFIAWPQIERFHWDGDVLTVVPFTSFLMGCGSIGRPVLGGSIRVPAGQRVQVENLLSVVQRARA
jgi:hypothetical protein